MPKASRRVANKIPQLSCELCHERKVQCDKLNPCTNCVRTGVDCTPVRRKRLPRGRHVHALAVNSSNDLLRRVARLEELVTTLDSSSPATQESQLTPSSNPSSYGTGKKTEENGATRYMAKQFWDNLVEEIHGLQGVINQPSEEEEDDDNDNNSDDDNQTKAHRMSRGQQARHGIGSSIIGLGSSHTGVTRSFVAGSLALRPVPAVCKQLCQVYLRQVDPIIKILHRPSLSRFMLDGESYLGYKDGHFSLEALSAAVRHSAISSMSEQQCQSIFHASKSVVGPGYQAASESAIERAGLTTTNDITVLQAFVLYLIATRSGDQSRAVWTLVPVAVRIAYALSLHVDNHRPSESFFEQQMRKRLWFTICLLDVQASIDRASEPLIGPDLSQPGLPKNINDSEFQPHFKGDLPDREDFTDITFALVTYNAQASGKALNFVPTTKSAQSHLEIVYHWNARQRCVEYFEQQTVKLLQHCNPGSSPQAWFTLHSSECMVASMKLSALRPLQRHRSAAPPQMQDCHYLLNLSAMVLEKIDLIRTDPQGEGLRWFEVIQWHAVAVAIAECYVCNDVALVRRLWPLIEASFEQHSHVIADYRQGMLWRPMEKLMRQTRNKISILLSPSNQNRPPSSASRLSQPQQGSGLVAMMTQSGISSAPPDSIFPPLPMTSQQTPVSMSIDFAMAEIEPAANTAVPPPLPACYPPNPSSAYQETLSLFQEADEVARMTSDPAWGAWEDFINDFDFSFDEVTGAGARFLGSDAGSGSVYDDKQSS